MGINVFNIKKHKDNFRNKKEHGLTKGWLVECLKKMGSDNVVFQNECQFQFALAWAIKEFFNYEISLEEVTLIDKFSNKKRRAYSDIVVKIAEDKYIAIELKYKTAKKSVASGDEEDYGEGGLTQQGAQGFGKYDFLWDVNRNEFLIYGQDKIKAEEKIIQESNNYRLTEDDIKNYTNLQVDKELDIPSATEIPKKGKFSSAFSIFLTNDKAYYTCPKKNSQEYNFRLAEKEKNSKRKFNATDTYFWKTGDNKQKKSVEIKYPKKVILSDDIRGKARGRILSFLQDYECEWEDYEDRNNSFKFLIFKTEMQNNP